MKNPTKRVGLVQSGPQSGLEPTIYCTQGEHANHYTTDAVSDIIE
jgi:hypothetical protein